MSTPSQPKAQMDAFAILAKLSDMRRRARARTGVDVYEYINGQRVSATHYSHSNACVMGMGPRAGLKDGAIVAALTRGDAS